MCAIAGILLATACASSSPEEDYFLREAERYFASGDFEHALRQTEFGSQRPPFDRRGAEISLQLEILRAMGRAEEVSALAEFVDRYTAGADTDTEETVPTRDECAELARRRSRTTRLVRKYGELPVRRPFEIGDLMATYEIDAEGNPVHIRVVRARHPASAWLIIDAIGQMKVKKVRLARIDPAEFPVPHCVYSVRPPPVRSFL